ncbi:HHR011Cp [Eremothecium sinecaudum]|uniref:ATP-dependent RNA helicase DRS1 n=1 Tax=Eremothecium sinecaudum TaxID=45286 RepID=A0A0X8HWI9_9SACH|nr:HHR011Cp [Eremothecium sinecaudum]AMD22780.1 HHR011Cp [Eremothecium sinecaudum]
MAIRKFKGFNDFVPTISDSEEDVPDLDASDDDMNQNQSKRTKPSKNKKSKSKVKGAAESEDEAKGDLNPDFMFAVDNSELTTNFEGWDFAGDEKSENKTDVDIDGIIRRKGGLVQMAAGAEDSSDCSESEDSEQENAEKEQIGEEDDDDLALDGFGMGAKRQNFEAEQSEEESAVESEAESSLSSEEDNDREELKSSVSDEEVKEEDTVEEMAKFYAPEEEGHEAKKCVHTTFNTLSLSRPVLKGLNALGYVKPSPIQSATIPIALLGKDIIAGAVTGSGKTAAFMIPIIERLLYKPAKIACTRVLVLTPTRELAIQVSDVGKKIGAYVNSLSFGLAVGGLNLRQQEQSLKSRPDVVIATPGRIIDHIRNSASFNVDSVEILVIDEADRMLEEGFQDELNEIMSLVPSKRQTLLFSATMNSRIKQLVSLSLKKPVRIMIDPPKQAASKLSQEFVRIRKRDQLKPALLYHLIRKLDPTGQKRIVVFVSRKEMAHRLRIILGLLGMKVGELHGSLTQEQRLKSVNDFKTLEVPVLVCTDLASRGLDIPKIEVVINFDMPKSYEIYLHRVGRTARAGREGRSVTFVGESTHERSIVRNAVNSVDSKVGRGSVCGRNVDWNKVEEVNKVIISKEDLIGEVLEEEKQEKEILRAEMEIRKGQNLLKHKAEIQSRPKRTWFQTESEKKNSSILSVLSKNKKLTNSKQRKRLEAVEDSSSRSYKKTKKDRSEDQERSFRKKKLNQKIKNKKKFRKG